MQTIPIMSPPARLLASARRLLFAFLFIGLAQPLVGTFTTIFLWRQGKSFPILALYTLALYLFVPLGFFLSYRLVGRVTHKFLFLLGTVGAGTIPLLLIFSPTFIPAIIILFGALFGVAQGFLWSTRNYLTLKATTKESRLHFSSIESLIGTLCGIIIPFLIGWGLEIGTKMHWFTILQGYRWMGIIGCLLLGVGGMLVYDQDESLPKPISLKLLPPTTQWNLLRSMDFIQGIANGIATILPLILTITFIGVEGAVGTLGSIGAGLTGIVIFIAGRYATHRHHLKILPIPLIIDLFAAAIAIIAPPHIGIILFLVTSLATGALRWWVTVATMYHAVEMEKKLTGSSNEGLLLDRELVLNIGRVLGLGLFLLAYHLTPIQAPFIAIVFMALIQLTIYPICRMIR